MSFTVQKQDIDLLFQKNKNTYLKIVLLNNNFQVVQEIQGITISYDLSVDASSDIRRTGSLSLCITNKNYQDIIRNTIWINRSVKVQYGVLNNRTKETKWYSQGVFMITDNEYQMTDSEFVFKLSLVDLVAQYNESRGSQITTETTIPVDVTLYPCPVCGNNMKRTDKIVYSYDDGGNSKAQTISTYSCEACGYTTHTQPEATAVYAKIRNAMISTLERWTSIPYSNMYICEFPTSADEVPYDLEYSIGAYPFDIIKDLRDLYPCYETFFDVDGNFVCQQIPMSSNDTVVLNEQVMDKLIISENRKCSFSNVVNVHDIWGASIEADRTAIKSEFNLSSDIAQYIVYVENLKTMDSGVYYGFTAKGSSTDNSIITFKNTDETFTSNTLPILVRYGDNYERPVKENEIKNDVPYAVEYCVVQNANGVLEEKVYLLGELQIRGIVKTVAKQPSDDEIKQDKEFFGCENIYYDIDKDNPFACDVIGNICRACEGNEYSNIYTVELAYERGRYENYKTTRLQNTVELQTLLIPFLDVNQKIQYTSPITKEIKQYLIQGINLNYSEGTMTLSLTEFFPYYEWNI